MIACNQCEWMGYPVDCERVSPPVLAPGESWVAPYGKCPECGAVIPHTAPDFNGDRAIEARSWKAMPPERKNLTQFQRDALLIALARLTPDHPGFRGSDEISHVLQHEIPLPPGIATFNNCNLAVYINSWVRPLIEAALYGPTYYQQSRYAADDAAPIREALEKLL